MQKDPSELLSALDSLCLYRIEDWWTYELCYKKHVRQFHKVCTTLPSVTLICQGQGSLQGRECDAQCNPMKIPHQ